MNQAYLDDSSNPSAVAALWDMRMRIQVGDYVVMPMRHTGDGGSLFSVGVVVGKYRYDATRPRAYHHRPVRWIFRSIPRSILLPELRRAIEHQGTSRAVYAEHAVERILVACEAHEARRQQSVAQP